MIRYVERRQNTNLNLKLIHSLHFLTFPSWMEQNKRTQHEAAAAATAGKQMHEYSQQPICWAKALEMLWFPTAALNLTPLSGNQMSGEHSTEDWEKPNLVKLTGGLYKYQNQSFCTN